MGSFIGHVVPGSFFFLVGVVWFFQICRRYFSAQLSRQRFQSSAMLSQPIGRFKINPEAAFAVFCSGVGLMIELRGIYLPTQHVHLHHMQHATMYFFFGLLGFISLFKDRLQRHLPDIDSVEYIFLTFCFASMALLFKFHLMGRNEVDTTVHILLVNTAALLAVTCLLEMWKRESVIAASSRAFLTCCIGTWFWQVAFILYNPAPGAEKWDPTDHHNIMLISCIYTWHLAALMILFIAISVLVSFCHERQYGIGSLDPADYVPQGLTMGSVEKNGYSKLLADSPDTEIDIN